MIKNTMFALLTMLLLGGHAMAGCNVTYTFANGTTADATQVNRDFSDITSCAAPLSNPYFSGNVGISTPSVDAILEVGTPGDSATRNAVVFASDSPRIYLQPDITHVNWKIAAQDTMTETLTIAYGLPNADPRLSSYTDAFAVNSSGYVGIDTDSPSQALEVNGSVKIDSFGVGTATSLCENSGVVSLCSSSIRYKKDVRDAHFGLKDVEAMRPVTFKWKGRNQADFGLIAEEMAKINPLFVTYNKGHIEGVKYAQLVAVLVNATKQLKASNDRQDAEIHEMRLQMSALQRRVEAQTSRN